MRRGAVLFATVALLLAMSAAVALSGTDGFDSLDGTGANDVLLGRGGGDIMLGKRGGDALFGGGGRDSISGDRGEDALYGGSGGDQLYADDGLKDSIFCGGGTDTVFVDAVDHVAPGCEVDGPDALRGGVLATFEVLGERFQVWVVNPQTIWDLYQLERGLSTASIPNGRILRGPGRAAHNVPYDWHLDPRDISMAEFTTEVCDAKPSYVEENVGEFVDSPGRYCPWSARLVELRNYTGGEIEPPATGGYPPPATFPDEG
jgi:RTX calcium-binding nonapeptide repeat (4 copies)